MRQIFENSIYFGVILSIVCYIIGLKIRKRFNYGILNPILIAMILTISVLTVLNIDFKTYNIGAQYLSFFLTPATVCLAIPLYQQINLLKKHFKAIFFGVLAGSIANLLGILALSILFKFSHDVYISLLPKSITTAIGLAVSGEIGGIETITIAAITVTGISGNVVGEFICKIFKIKNPIAAGLAFGTSSHVIGTSKALELGEVQGAMGSLAIAVAGLITVVLAPIFANFYM